MPTHIEFLVAGGRATPGHPIGPELGPTPVDVQDAVTAINERTAAFDGMDVPVTISYEEDGRFDLEVGVPSTAELIKREVEIGSGSGRPQSEFVADLAVDQLLRVTAQKLPDLNAYDLTNGAKEIAGTCVSLGVTIDGNDPREFARRIDAGDYDEPIDAVTTEAESG